MKTSNLFGSLKGRGKRAEKINFILCAIIIISVLTLAVQWIVSYVKTGYAWELMIFQRTRGVVFDDFFHVNYMVANNDPYFEGLSSYPPFVLVIAKFFALFGDYSQGYGNEVMFAQASAIFSVVLYYLIFAAASEFCLIYFLKKHCAGVCGIVVYSLAFFVSMPVVYNLERGNYIFFALTFSLAFFTFYDHKKFLVRELSYISLAFAVGIKLYPALFAVILLKEKRFADLLRCAAYSVLAVLLSFLVFDGGFSNIERFIEALTDFSSNLTDYGFNLSLASFIGYFANAFCGYELFTENQTVQSLQSVVPFIAAVIFIAAALFQNKKWKTFSLAAITMVLFPNLSYQYSAMFLLIPLLAFIVEKQKGKADYFYMILLYLPLIPISFGTAISDGNVTWNLIFADLAMIISGICLTCEAVINAVKFIRSKTRRNPISI